MMNPFKTKKGLGRGLSSLIGDTDSKPIKNKISISSIIRNKFQPRKNFDKEKMEDLTNSIRERGIIQPIIVRKSSDQNNKFEIIAGERRWHAAQNAGLHEVPVVEIEADNLKSLEFAIVENVQRSDLNPIEEAKGYKKLIDEFDYDQDKVSKFIDKTTVTVYPTPNSTAASKDMHIYYVKRIQDLDATYTDASDVPYRFVACMCSGLAFYLSQKFAPQRSQELKLYYEDELARALSEDGSSSSTHITPKTYYPGA